ncbi:BnaC02g09700D [Brassica napus]|uniref:BnaC02g09700D protein n=1 Tax=Brassica napus TaxID=3708 RepID=A0A078HE33_BRANA|nr:BnaC02g09700D [Brassica napus]
MTFLPLGMIYSNWICSTTQNTTSFSIR